MDDPHFWHNFFTFNGTIKVYFIHECNLSPRAKSYDRKEGKPKSLHAMSVDIDMGEFF